VTIQALLRLSPRQLRGTTLTAWVTRRRATAAGGAIGLEEVWGLIGTVGTAQASETTAATASAAGASVVIQVGQASQSVSATGNVASDGPTETGQAAQTTDATGMANPFRQIKGSGWHDSAIVASYPKDGFWRINPRQLFSGSMFSRLVPFTSADASDEVGADEFFGTFTRIETTDGFGTPSVGFPIHTAAPAGIAAGDVGTHTVFNLTQYVAPSGIGAGAVGTPSNVYNRTQSVVPSGLAAFKGFGFGADGVGFVSFLDRTVTPGGFTLTTFGTTLVSNLDRTVEPPHFDATTYGTARVEYRVREVLPEFIPATSYGTAVVDRTHFVDLTGDDTSAFGVAYVHDNRQFTTPAGLSTLAIGDVRVSRSPQVVAPGGFPSARDVLPNERWGLPETHNNRRYVTQLYDATLPGEGGVFGDPIFMSVANRNRTVAPLGWDSGKVHRVYEVANKARAVVPSGFDASSFGNALPAYRIRHLPLDGIAPGQFGQWLVTYNNARLVAPASGVQTAFGTATVVNTRRYFDHIGGNDLSVYGDALVAYRVRFVAPPLGPEGALGTPSVRNGTTYVTPSGMSQDDAYGGRWGLTNVEIHFNIAAPRSILSRLVVSNEATVLNRNRAATPYAYDMSEWGRPHVFNLIQEVRAGAIDFGALGHELAVAYRTRTVYPTGINATTISPFAHPHKTTPDPPEAQNVRPDGRDMSLYGSANVHANSVYPAGDEWTGFGRPSVRTNTVAPVGIQLREADRFGDVRTNFTQIVTPDGLKAPDDPLSPEPKPLPRLSPFTIYCTITGKPPGYTPSGPPWELVDASLIPPDQVGYPVWGTPAVTHRNRRVFPVPFLATGMTIGHDVMLRQRRIPVDGIRGFKSGFPTVGPFTIVVEDVTVPGDAAFGLPLVEHYIDPAIPRSVKPGGLTASYGTASVDLLNRTLPMSGWDSFTMSAPAPYLGPAVFGPLSTRVHFPEPVQPAGITGFFGTTWVSFRVRSVTPDGWDSFTEGFELDTLRDRMRVSQRTYARPSGIASAEAFGTARVSNKQRSVGPDPANRLTQFGNASVRPFQIVGLQTHGIDSLAMGTPEKWQAGDPVRTWGADHAGYGTPRIDRVLHGAGFAASSFGAPVVGPYIRVSGMATDEYGVATFSYADGHEFVCGQRPRAIPPQGFTSAGFGAPTVA
jgi:hypothetical protein